MQITRFQKRVAEKICQLNGNDVITALFQSALYDFQCLFTLAFDQNIWAKNNSELTGEYRQHKLSDSSKRPDVQLCSLVVASILDWLLEVQ